ncbi:MAG TPA: hypothetical protein VHV10_05030, partial [Ktedonobacteraceae bacterium]|nr:hypothetical protein [Ktedonobacteraceae bacterium]
MSEITYQIGRIVKIVDAIGGTVCARVERIQDKKIFATLLHTGGTYEYESEDLAPATEEDIAKAKAWHERNVSMLKPTPLSVSENTYPWDLFD